MSDVQSPGRAAKKSRPNGCVSMLSSVLDPEFDDEPVLELNRPVPLGDAADVDEG